MASVDRSHTPRTRPFRAETDFGRVRTVNGDVLFVMQGLRDQDFAALHKSKTAAKLALLTRPPNRRTSVVIEAPKKNDTSIQSVSRKDFALPPKAFYSYFNESSRSLPNPNAFARPGLQAISIGRRFELIGSKKSRAELAPVRGSDGDLFRRIDALKLPPCY